MSAIISALTWALILALLRAAQEFQPNPTKRADLFIYFVAIRWTWTSGAAQIRALTFWSLSALLASRGPTLLTRIIWRLHLFLGAQFAADGVTFPGFTVGGRWVALFVYGKMLHTAATYAGVHGVLVTVATVYGCRGFMYPYNVDFDFTWACAWWLVHMACTYVMAPGMRLWWYGMWYGILATAASWVRPDQSRERFIAWAAGMIALRGFVYYVYLAWLMRDVHIISFSSFAFVRRWRLSKPVWTPLSARDRELQDHPKLCRQCDRITRKSALIMGSSLFFTKLVEWHAYWGAKEMCLAFGDGLAHSRTEVAEPNSEPRGCDFCCLIWSSMSLERRRSLIETTVKERADRFASSHLPLPTGPRDGLRLKIWEERPLSPYTFAQLYWGEIAIGARILIHREKLFAEPSPAVDQAHTSSSQHFAQAKEWAKQCSENHNLCNSIDINSPELPTRLLYVHAGESWQPGDQPAILKLVRTASLDRRPEYLAFSHCWGAPEGMQFKLLARNIEQCYEQIDFKALSKNMQDAIITTLCLGICPYIWIDSLCIIQRDECEGNGDVTWKRDWEIEARKMGGVYWGATLTIASTGSSSSDGGCFHPRNTQSLRPVKVGVSSRASPDADWIFARADDIFDFERNVNSAPLNTRGWVMQERLLSRRILHFGAEMIYWECRRRSASEFNPHGYTYKSYPEDFEDWYVPNVAEFNTRRDIERGERQGRGVSWAGAESVRQRPPPVMPDPDTEAMSSSSGNREWQRRRGFWKDVLKRTDGPWSADEIAKEKGRRDHSGFRAIFEAFRSKPVDSVNPYAWAMQNHSGITEEKTPSQKGEAQVGRSSFSQRWYDIVEPYSRGKLTMPADKLMALKGIQDEIARATGFTYLYGLWRESLVTDMLWFAIEGPGRRLRTDHGAVGPTWSWVSVDAPVAVDFLPENSRGHISLKQQLVTIVDVLSDTSATHDPPNLAMPCLELCGCTFQLSRASPDLQRVDGDADADVWEIRVREAKTMAVKVFFDTDAQDVFFESSFTCLPFLILERKAADTSSSSRTNDTQGLVMRLVRMRDRYNDLDVYERVGYFTTSYMPTSPGLGEMQAALKSRAVQRLRLAG